MHVQTYPDPRLMLWESPQRVTRLATLGTSRSGMSLLYEKNRFIDFHAFRIIFYLWPAAFVPVWKNC